jgi:lipopolysaccharide transport system ATP-binding protein
MSVRFDSVFKYFHRHARQMLLRERLVSAFRQIPQERFYALSDVSFSLDPGDSLAVIGHNGAGKSTLLNIATGLCKPSEGRVTIEGRVAPLLELGAGFHPDLTGTENVFINASLLGLSRRQARVWLDQIVEFAELRDFMDEPLRTYSSGMVMRLAFSIAISVDPDILVIDEVLGVGDQDFSNKCVDKISEFRRAGKTLICVSHSLDTLEELCDQALWLEHGKIWQIGPAAQVIPAYRQSAHAHFAANPPV